MEIPMVDLRLQYQNLKDEIDKAILGVLGSGQFILGENVKEFEKELAEYCNVRHAIGVASGTDALYLALRACGVGPGDEVITTPFSFVATAEVIILTGAKPVFVDIDEETYNISPSKIKSYITDKTKAIIPVHLYGLPAEMDLILEVASSHGLKVIEDACQAIGAEYKGRRIGGIGHIGCLSFFPSKNLGCYGDGGAVLTNDDELAEKIKVLRVHGSYEKYMHSEIGINSRLDEIQAAILRVKLKYLEDYIEERRIKAKIYTEELAEICTVPFEPDYCRHVYHQYTIQIRNRDLIASHLKSKGIATAIYYPIPLHLQECFKYLDYKKGSLPVSEAFSKRVISLPMYPELTTHQVRFICDCIKEAVK
jgi:dTDP-4-amino-4,6-dideoxygalactose transaminase